MTIQIAPLSDATVPAWDAFVSSCPGATFFHRAGWRTVLERAFQHRTHFVMAKENDAIVGVLPLAELRSRLFGHHLISTPFCAYGGVAAVSHRAANALTE